jgi:hypothetical protein
MSQLSDDDFVQAFLSGALTPAEFHHRDHLWLAWCLVRQRGMESATHTITAGIRTFATRHGQAGKYHETMTRFWVRLVGHMVEVHPDITAFATFLATFPQLLDKDLPYRHWRRETMAGATARTEWVEPDLVALPV